MMKKLLVIIFIFSLTSVFAQQDKPKKKPLKRPPPPPKRFILPPPPVKQTLSLSPDPAKLTDEEAIKLILHPYYSMKPVKPAERYLPVFLWKINEDTMLPPKTLYEEFVDLSGNGRIIRHFTEDSVEIKKDTAPKISTTIANYADCSVDVANDILILTNNKNKEVERFKAFLDKKKERILRIQSLKTGKFYEYEKAGYPVMPMIMVK